MSARDAVPETSPRRRGRQLFVPTESQRQSIKLLAGIGVSQRLMLRLLADSGAGCKDEKTLRRAFRLELDIGREMLVAKLASKMVEVALGGSFPALAYLLARFGGPEWKLPEGRGEALPGIGTGGNVHFYMPANGRDRPEAEDEGPLIEAEDAAA
jgi:hypothetical protein